MSEPDPDLDLGLEQAALRIAAKLRRHGDPQVVILTSCSDGLRTRTENFAMGNWYAHVAMAELFAQRRHQQDAGLDPDQGEAELT